MIKLGIVGATGQLGMELLKFVNQIPDFEVVGAVSSKNNKQLGISLSEVLSSNSDNMCSVKLSDDITYSMINADVIIDCTNSRALETNISYYKELRKPLIIATTNLCNNVQNDLYEMANSFPICVSNNFSVLFSKLVKMLKSGLVCFPKELDSYIIETHSKKKKDKPSGTAIDLKKIISETMNVDVDIHSVRVGSGSGVHEISFVNEYNEKICITYSTGTRISYVNGIVLTCKKIIEKQNGYYSFEELYE